MARAKTYTIDKNEWYCADFETTTINTEYYKQTGDSRVILYNIKKFSNGENVDTGYNIENFLDFCFNGVSKTIYFHNLAWDGCFIIPALISMGFSLSFKSKSKNKKIELFQQGDTIYYIRASIDSRVKGKRVKYNVIFRDTLSLMPTSIKNLGDSLNIAKYKSNQNTPDFYDVEPGPLSKEFIEYCERDVEILQKSLFNYYDMIHNIEAVREYNMKNYDNPFSAYSYLTVGATAMGIIKNIYMPRFRERNGLTKFKLSINEDTYKIAKKVYRGGITQYNDLYLGEPKKLQYGGVCIDRVSSYPAEMVKWLPYGEMLTEIDETVPHQVFVHVIIKNLKIKPLFKNQPCFPRGQVEADVRYLSNYRDEIEQWFVLEEYIELSKRYDWEVVDYEEYYMRTAPFLQEAITDLYQLKDHYDKVKNPSFKLISKLLLNSVYGKMCENESFDSFLYDTDIIEKDSILYHGHITTQNEDGSFSKQLCEYNVKHLSKRHSWGNFKTYRCELLNKKAWLPNKAAGAVISAKARVALLEIQRFCIEWGYKNRNKIKISPEQIWMYSDTDSIFIQAIPELIKELKKKYIKKELGYWDIERKNNTEIFTHFGTNGAKQYAALVDDKPWKTGLAGIKLDYLQAKQQDLNWDYDTNILHNASTKKEKTENGCVIITVDKKFKKGRQ